MSSVGDGNRYEGVFAYEDLIYAMERMLRVVHVYRNRNNSLIKLYDIKYPCICNDGFFYHSIIVTNEHIIQCCARDKLVSILDRSGELLRKISVADTTGPYPYLRQADSEGNFFITDPATHSLLITLANQPSSQWRVVDLADWPVSGGCRGAVWFRHRLYVSSDGHLMTFTPADLNT